VPAIQADSAKDANTNHRSEMATVQRNYPHASLQQQQTNLNAQDTALNTNKPTRNSKS
jgi:hypothetical protein